MDFSIIIPAYNCEKTILQTVESIEEIQYDSMELILIDDGSTDSTCEICKHITDKFSNVRYYYQDNSGVSAARNYGVLQAKGTYVLFCDSDDKVNSALLKKCMLKAIDEDADMLIFGIVFHYSYRNRITWEEYMNCNNNVLLDSTDLIDNLAYLFDINYLSSVWNKIFKRSLCNKVCFNTTKKEYEDLLYVLEYIYFCKNILLMPDLAYIYYIYLPINNSSRTKCIEDFNLYMKEFQNAVNRLEEHLDADLLELRHRIFRVYELILQDKLINSSYHELRALNHTKMRISLFGELYNPSAKIPRLFFDNKLIELKIYCFYRALKDALKTRLRK